MWSIGRISERKQLERKIKGKAKNDKECENMMNELLPAKNVVCCFEGKMFVFRREMKGSILVARIDF